MFVITDELLDVSALERAVAGPDAGALLIFRGVSRADDGPEGVVEALDYSAYHDMALVEMRRVADAIAGRWPGTRTAIAHRTGRVAVGETSILIVVASGHRVDAYEASRFAIDTLKERLPVWKKEIFTSGERWRSNAEALATAAASGSEEGQ